LKDIVILSF